MIEKMNYSPLEFTYNPNNLITFLNRDCKIRGLKYSVPESESSFLQEAFDPNVSVVERHGPRQSGGTTLLGFIAIYYLVQGRSVTFMFNTREMLKHFLHFIIPEMELEEYAVEWTNYSDGSYGMYLKMCKGMARSTGEIKLKSGGEDKIRGGRHDILLVDGFIHQSLGDHQRFIQQVLFPSICDNRGKVIMNVCK